MAKANSIAPFPSDIDRTNFGHWIAGFVDGEGSFFLKSPVKRGSGIPIPSAEFRIALRADDAAVLRLVHSYFQCGHVRYYNNARCKVQNAKPIVTFHVGDTIDLETVIVPHFESHPLFAKKRTDFWIWKEGVQFLRSVQKRPKPRGMGQRGGWRPRWSEDDIASFLRIQGRLRANRVFVPPALAG